MTSKEQLVNILKDWLVYDDKLRTLQQEMKELRNKKKTLTGNLVSIMKENEIDCFDVNTGKIIYCKNKTKVPLNNKTLLEILEKYFQNKPDIDVTSVRDFLLDNRETKITENIRRK